MIKVEGEEVRMSKNEFDKILIFWDKSLTLTSDTVGCKPEIKDEMMREVTKYYRKLQRLIKDIDYKKDFREVRFRKSPNKRKFV